MLIKKLALLATTIFISSSAYAGHWTYEGEEGPEHWGELSPDFEACLKGKTQSPIDIQHEIKAAKAVSIKFNYATDASEILNNGHTVQANVAAGSSITVDGIDFQLQQFHFHTPSENLIHGKSFPMEMHLVHADKDGNLAVVAVMIKESKENAALAKLWTQMPQNADEKNVLTAKVNPSSLLPKSRGYYRFDGSLTTPPCSEGVRWMVLKDPINASKEQIEAFAKVVHGHDARPAQQVRARIIVDE
jgi:carbonic anhydrase